jgi:hypothetical protein
MKIQSEGERKMGLENMRQRSQNVPKLKCIVMIIGLGILTWIRSSMLTMPLLKKNNFLRYTFHNDKRQTWAKVEVQHLIKAPSNEIVTNNDIRVYKDVSKEPDTASASVKK